MAFLLNNYTHKQIYNILIIFKTYNIFNQIQLVRWIALRRELFFSHNIIKKQRLKNIEFGSNTKLKSFESGCNNRSKNIGFESDCNVRFKSFGSLLKVRLRRTSLQPPWGFVNLRCRSIDPQVLGLDVKTQSSESCCLAQPGR